MKLSDSVRTITERFHRRSATSAQGRCLIAGMLVTTGLFAIGCATEARSLANQASPDAVAFPSVDAPAVSPPASSSTVYSPAAQQYLVLVTALDAVGAAGHNS
jgi:hypothetical protein